MRQRPLVVLRSALTCGRVKIKSFMLEAGRRLSLFHLMITSRRSLALRRQCVEIVAAFFEQALFDESFDNVEDFLACFGIVAARLKEFMQIERLFLHLLEHAEHALPQFIHRSMLSARSL